MALYAASTGVLPCVAGVLRGGRNGRGSPDAQDSVQSLEREILETIRSFDCSRRAITTSENFEFLPPGRHAIFLRVRDESKVPGVRCQTSRGRTYLK